MDKNVIPKECDSLCKYRECFSVMEDKGTYTPCRGYTSYYKNPEIVCRTRFLHGCPDGPEALRGRPLISKQYFLEEHAHLLSGKKAKVPKWAERMIRDYTQIIESLLDVIEETNKKG